MSDYLSSDDSSAYLDSLAADMEAVNGAPKIAILQRALRAEEEVRRLAEPTGWLIAYALHGLWRQSQDEDLQGCCWHRCAPCGALKTLLDSGDLDRLVPREERYKESFCWDSINQQVKREWLVPALERLCDGRCAHIGRTPVPRGDQGAAD